VASRVSCRKIANAMQKKQPSAPQDSKRQPREENHLEGLASITSMLIIWSFVMGFVLQNFVIPSSSMASTLLVGDHVMTLYCSREQVDHSRMSRKMSDGGSTRTLCLAELPEKWGYRQAPRYIFLDERMAIQYQCKTVQIYASSEELVGH
jgi:hypothetical protein